MRVNGPWHLSGAPRTADPGSEVDETGAAEWEGVSPGGFSRICPKVALAGMSLDWGGDQPWLSGCSNLHVKPLPTPAALWSFPTFLFMSSVHSQRIQLPFPLSLKRGISQAAVEPAMGACISTPCVRLQDSRMRDKSTSPNTGIRFRLYKRMSITRVPIRDQDAPTKTPAYMHTPLLMARKWHWGLSLCLPALICFAGPPACVCNSRTRYRVSCYSSEGLLI